MDVFIMDVFKVRILSACAFSHYWAEQGTKVSAMTPIQQEILQLGTERYRKIATGVRELRNGESSGS